MAPADAPKSARKRPKQSSLGHFFNQPMEINGSKETVHLLQEVRQDIHVAPATDSSHTPPHVTCTEATAVAGSVSRRLRLRAPPAFQVESNLTSSQRDPVPPRPLSAPIPPVLAPKSLSPPPVSDPVQTDASAECLRLDNDTVQQVQSETSSQRHKIPNATVAVSQRQLKRPSHNVNRPKRAPLHPVEAPLTDYEQQRLDRIRRNQEYMQSLGIDSPIPNQPTKAPLPKVRPKPRFNEPCGPVRRSSRLTSQPSDAKPDLADHVSDGQDLPPQDEADLDAMASWDDSSVHTYLCSRTLTPADNSNPDAQDQRRLLGFRAANRELADPSLPRIYSVAVEADKGLLAAGGHQGRMAVFAVPDGGGDGEGMGGVAEAPLLSWKAGRGWISQVHFLAEGGAGSLLLSSSNDRLLCLWDLTQQQAGGAPRQVASTDRLHSQGIFGMHELGLRVATASKDRTVGLTRVGPTGLVGERALEGHHEAAVRCVHFRDAHTLADGGADSLVCILDLRHPSPCTLSLLGCHLSPVNSVEWHPTEPHLLLSSSHDPTLFLHDIRSPFAPLHKFQGHMNPRVQRSAQIYRPAFVWGGRGVATPGEGSGQVSLYRVDTGKAVSRGRVGFDATTLTASWGGGRDSLWVAAGVISELRPMWAENGSEEGIES